MLNALAQLPGLKVPAQTSSFYFKDKDIDAREIGAQLGVAYLVQGSVQRAGNKLRIVAQLIEAETGYQLWSEPYDRDIGNIFAVLDEVATMVARKMQVTLPGGGGKIETVGTDNVAAFDWYLKGMEQKNKKSNTNLLQAEISFRQALANDPDFFEARLERAFTYLAQGNFGEITSAEANEKLIPLLDRLQEERPDNGLVLILAIAVQYNRAEIQGDGSFKLDKHLAELSAAIERTPNEARLYVAIANYLRDAGRPDEFAEWVERGIVVDPLNWALHMRRGGYLLFGRGDLDGAEAAFAKAMELNPDNPSALSRIGSIHFPRKQFAQWFEFSRKGMDLGPLDAEFPGGFAIGLSWFGLIDEADKYLQRAIGIAPDNAFVRQAKLYHLLMKDQVQARDLSEDMLRDDIEDRFDTYWWAAIVFVSTMTELGETGEALKVLEELQPEVTSPGFVAENTKQQALQYVAVLALAQTQSSEDTLKLLDAVVRRWDRNQVLQRWRLSGPKFEGRYNAWKVVPIEMARGNTKRAIELALENLADVEEVMRFRHLYFWKELAQEPEVAARLRELEVEAKKGGEAIWDFIVENDLQLD
jgi:tetratricopeptide (TPR) repeat protein